MTKLNFAQLFRRSTFAYFDPRTPFIFAKTLPPPVLPNSPLQFEAVERVPNFGMKCEPPARQFGSSIDYVTFTALDGDFNLPVFTDAKARVLKRQIYNHLESLLSTEDILLPRVPGRVIESCEGGFLIGIGPVRAHLPQSEIPAGANFNYYDMLDRKAYYFNLKNVQLLNPSTTKKQHYNNVDIFSVDTNNHTPSHSNTNYNFNSHKNNNFNKNRTHQNNNNMKAKKPVSMYSKYAQEQGFKVILSLRK